MRHIGLSEVGAETIRRAAATHPISDLQIEYSLISRGLEERDPADVPRARDRRHRLRRPQSRAHQRALRGRPRAGRPTTSAPTRRASPRRTASATSPSSRRCARSPTPRASPWPRWRSPGSSAAGEDIVPLVGARTRERLAEALGALEVAAGRRRRRRPRARGAARRGRRRPLSRGADGGARQRAWLRAVAVEVRDVAPGLWLWRQPHPDWEEGNDWEPRGLVRSPCESRGVGVLLDPLAPPSAAARGLGAHRGARPDTLVVMKPDHVRDVDLFVRWYGARAYGPQLFWRDDVPHTELEPVQPGDELPGGLRALYDGRSAAETPLYLPEQRALVFADALCGLGGALRVWATPWHEERTLPYCTRCWTCPSSTSSSPTATRSTTATTSWRRWTARPGASTTAPRATCAARHLERRGRRRPPARAGPGLAPSTSRRGAPGGDRADAAPLALGARRRERHARGPDRSDGALLARVRRAGDEVQGGQPHRLGRRADLLRPPRVFPAARAPPAPRAPDRAVGAQPMSTMSPRSRPRPAKDTHETIAATSPRAAGRRPVRRRHRAGARSAYGYVLTFAHVQRRLRSRSGERLETRPARAGDGGPRRARLPRGPSCCTVTARPGQRRRRAGAPRWPCGNRHVLVDGLAADRERLCRTTDAARPQRPLRASWSTSFAEDDASAAFAFSVGNFGSCKKTYGALAGPVDLPGLAVDLEHRRALRVEVNAEWSERSAAATRPTSVPDQS